MRRMLWSAACGAAILAAFGAAAAADDDGMGGPPAVAAPAPDEDVLVLKDGTEVRGRITAEDDAGYAVKVGGSLRVVEKSGVKEVRRGTPAPAEEPAGTPVDSKSKDGKEKRKERRRGDGEAPPLSEEARTWARSCIDRLQTEDPAVQRSAAEALRALGPSVLPFLREARDGADDKGKQVLERVLGTIERGPPKGPDAKMPRPGQGPDAKPGQPGPGRGPAFLERVKTDLALDEARSRTVGGSLLTFGRESREVLADARDGLITYEDARTKVTGLRGKLRDDLKTTLTEEQLVKLDGLLDEMAKRLGGGGPPKKDAPPPAKTGEPAR